MEDSDSKEFREHLQIILEAVQKIDPAKKAGYMLWDERGTRYFEVDYEQQIEN